MSKHVFGFAVFAVIVVSFAFLFALVRLQIVPVPEVFAPPVKDLAVRVESSYFDLDSGKLVTEVRLTWNGPGDAPDSVKLRRDVFAAGSSETSKFSDATEFKNVFSGSRTARVTLSTEKMPSPDAAANLYVRVGGRTERETVGESPVTAVLFVHGESSKIPL